MLDEMFPVKCLKICFTFGMQKPMHFSAWFFNIGQEDNKAAFSGAFNEA